MAHMKKIIPLFLLALLPLAASAEMKSVYVFPATIYFDADEPICYTYATVEGAVVGDALPQKEQIRVLTVNDVRTDTTSLPFAIDFQGNPVPADGLTANHMVWMNLSWRLGATSFTGSVIPVGTIPGMPEGDGATPSDSVYQFDIVNGYITLEGSLESGDTDTYPVDTYIVALDTRYQNANGDFACDGTGTYVARYAVAKIPSSLIYPAFAAGAHSFSCRNFTSSESLEYGTDMSLPGLAQEEDGGIVDAWANAALPKSLIVVDEETGTQKTLTGAELEDYLSPAIASATFTDPESGTLPDVKKTLQIQASSTDLVCYTLYTATSLTGDWTTFDALLAEKKVDTDDEKKYTRFRIDGESKTITIPVYDDATRFYQFRMN